MKTLCGKMHFTIYVFLLLFQKLTVAEEYNLFGFAGLGYAIEIHLGHPPQRLNVLLDTGSSTLAVAAAAHSDITTHFALKNSTTAYDTGDEVHARYTEGDWSGKLIRDYVKLPTLVSAPEVKANIALINNSHDFFMNGSGWQGILGLAYQAIGAIGSLEAVPPWLQSVEADEGKTMSFSIKLCGHPTATNTTHYGSFQLIDDMSKIKDHNHTFYTNILRERWFEIGVLSVRVITPKKPVTFVSNTTKSEEVIDIDINRPNSKYCRILNAQKSIVDCGTTNIRVPSAVYKQIVGEIREQARLSNILILDKFWYDGETACWPEPREFSLPWLAIDILDAENDHQYFTIEYPPQTYMRLMSAHKGEGTVAEYCYKLGLEPGETTVLGVVVFEGLQILFNKEKGRIGFQTSNCGPEIRISGPHNSTKSLRDMCNITYSAKHKTALETKVAQWASVIALAAAMTLAMYLLTPCIRTSVMRSLRRMPTQISLSRISLVSHEPAERGLSEGSSRWR